MPAIIVPQSIAVTWAMTTDSATSAHSACTLHDSCFTRVLIIACLHVENLPVLILQRSLLSVHFDHFPLISSILFLAEDGSKSSGRWSKRFLSSSMLGIMDEAHFKSWLEVLEVDYRLLRGKDGFALNLV